MSTKSVDVESTVRFREGAVALLADVLEQVEKRATLEAQQTIDSVLMKSEVHGLDMAGFPETCKPTFQERHKEAIIRRAVKRAKAALAAELCDLAFKTRGPFD